MPELLDLPDREKASTQGRCRVAGFSGLPPKPCREEAIQTTSVHALGEPWKQRNIKVESTDLLMATCSWKAQRNLEAVIDQPLKCRQRTNLLTI